ncbi:ABC transporter ATP-binding protein [Leucobacter sp. OH1287]|uniref:dipeptide ABC transporter ATP-binding protein n=1 Tax=Leucobacter sp. OH1287 TaxID=2491049 RepID=UPI000F5D50EA|nr:ABC transporter ATP-binding protein [Leucobacter sp. OH1287]RRD61892.1 ABC transporter ATP-binding protein [Leucobacter sp. OH1287]
MNKLLRIHDLTITAGEKTLLDRFSISVGSGERVGLIGESGSGKTLTLKAILGLLPNNLATAGEIYFADHETNLLTASEKQLAHLRGNAISMVFQEPLKALNPLHTVGKQIAEAALIHNTAKTRAEALRLAADMLAAVNIPDPHRALKSYPHELSGGQRQRVIIAIALLNNPRLLLCDEPTTALDVTVQKQVLDVISSLVTDHHTGLLFVTHDLAVIARMCDSVTVLKEGRIVESGPVSQVLTDPAHEYTRRLIAASTVHERPAVKLSSVPETAVSIRDVSRVFKPSGVMFRKRAAEKVALNGINLEIPRGSRLGIVGESGSGKTTLLRLLAGLDSPTSGAIEINGQPLSGGKRTKRGLRTPDGAAAIQTQLVFQDPHSSLNPRMRILDIITEPLTAKPNRVSSAERRQLAADMLHEVGLTGDASADELLSRYPHEFSGGQRQRIAIARALITKPSLLLADEPVSALDVSVREQILRLLDRLTAETGATLVIVSHDLATIKNLCDTVAVVYNGEIVEHASTDKLFSHPQHSYTQKLLAASLNLRGELAAKHR